MSIKNGYHEVGVITNLFQENAFTSAEAMVNENAQFTNLSMGTLSTRDRLVIIHEVGVITDLVEETRSVNGSHDPGR